MNLRKIGADYRRAKYDYLQKFILYEDSDFPADDDSLFYSNDCLKNHVNWKRPPDVVKSPVFYQGEPAKCSSPISGKFANCWLVAAMDVILQNPCLFAFVVPQNQDFNREYVGIFRFRIWRYGSWFEVTIDDRLPYRTPDSNDGVSLTTTSSDANFWVPLLEKAYAKLLGKYDDLSIIQTNDAITDFTSALCEMYAVQSWEGKIMYDAIRTSLKSRSIVLAYKVDKINYPKVEQAWSHVFVTEVEQLKMNVHSVEFDEGNVHLRIKVVCVAGRSPEDECAISANVADPSAVQNRNLTVVEGENWISCQTFRQIFRLFAIVNFPSTTDSTITGFGRTDLQLDLYHDVWTPDKTPGPYHVVVNMPAHHFSLNIPDEGLKNEQTAVMGLMQINRSLIKHTKEAKMMEIGLHVFSATSRSKTKLDNKREKLQTEHIRAKEYSTRYRFKLGDYVAVPCNLKRYRGGEYLLRILIRQRKLTLNEWSRNSIRRTFNFIADSSSLIILTLAAVLILLSYKYIYNRLFERN